MARPKEASVSLAFQEKCDQERDKLQQRLAKQLRSDMQRLLEEGGHSDVTLLLHGDCLQIHSTLIKLRAPGFYREFIADNHEGVVTIEEKDVDEVQQFIRMVYTSDDLPESRWASGDVNGNGGPSRHSDSDASHSNNTPAEARVSTFEENKENSAASTNGRPPGPGPHTGCCDLGTELLSLYHGGQNTDVIIEAKGKYFKAHKFILCLRSSYFAAMLGGSWKESKSQEIRLEGISAGVMEQALLYMYGGVAELSALCDVGELVMLADMYGIVGIKEIAMFVIKRDYCHFFHKPCSGCLSGICETLPLTLTFSLNDIQERCLRWSNKNFIRLWPTKPFALLPTEVLGKCCHHLISDINSMTVLDIIVDTDKLRGVMPQVRWADPVVEATTKVMDACVKYLSGNLVQTVRRKQFMDLGTTMAFVLEFLEGIFIQAINSMPVERACKSYLEFKKLKECTEAEDCDWTEDFKSLLRLLFKTCEHYMQQNVHLLVATPDWNLLPEQLQNQIKEGGFYVPTNDGNGSKTGTKLGGAVRPNKLPSKKRAGAKPGTSSRTPTPRTPSSAGSSISTGGRTPLTPGTRKGAAATPSPSGTSKTKTSTLPKMSAGKSLKSPAASTKGTMKTPSPGAAKSAESRADKPASVRKSQAQETAGKGNAEGRTSPKSQTSKLPRAGGLSPKPSASQASCSVGGSKKVESEVKPDRGNESPEKSEIPTVPQEPAADPSVERKEDENVGEKVEMEAGAQGSVASKVSADSKENKLGSRQPQEQQNPKAANPKSDQEKNVPKAKSGSGGTSKNKPSSRAPPGGAVRRQSKMTEQRTHVQTKNTTQKKPEKTVVKKASDPKKEVAKSGSKSPKPAGARPTSAKSSPRSLNSQRSQESKSPRSVTSSSSSVVSSPRSSASGSRLPVTEHSSARRPQPDKKSRLQISKNNDAVFAKCTSMRIAAMKLSKHPDTDMDMDMETESVVSMMSHVAVKGSRTPSLVDLDLWNDEQALNDVIDGQVDLAEVHLPPPKTFTDVIIPILQPSVAKAMTVTQKER